MSRFPVAFRPAGIRFLGILFPPRVWALLTVGLPDRLNGFRTLTGFPRFPYSRHGRDGRPLYPEASGVHATDKKSPVAACRSSTARPYTPVPVPSPEAHNNEASTGIQFRSPVRPSPLPAPPGWNGTRFGFFPELRTPQLLATHVKAGTGPEHSPGTTQPTSRRTSDPRARSQYATSCRNFFLVSTLITGSPAARNSPASVLMYRNWSSRSGC